MLVIARALMGNPEFILLDEPFEGLAPLLIQSFEEQIKILRRTGLTILIAEQNVKSTLKISDRDYIIDNGLIRYQGSILELRENQEIRKKYLLVYPLIKFGFCMEFSFRKLRACRLLK